MKSIKSLLQNLSIVRYFRLHLRKSFKKNYWNQLQRIRLKNENKRIKIAKKAAKKYPNVKIPTRQLPYNDVHKQVFKGLVGLYLLFQNEGMKRGLPFKKRIIITDFEDIQKAIRDLNEGLVQTSKIKEVINTFVKDGILEINWQRLKKKGSNKKHDKFKIQFSRKFKMRLTWKK